MKHTTQHMPVVHARAEARTDRAIIALIVVATLVTFAPLFRAEFVDWDDQTTVAHNPRLNPPTLESLAYYWNHPQQGLFVPLTYTTWWMLAIVARVDQGGAIELNPWIFHAANLMLHMGASLLVFAILRRLVGARWPACAGAMLFALHPIQVEAIAWVSGLKDVLAGVFVMLALWQYVVYTQEELRGPTPSNRGRLVTITLAFILAMLAKPSAMTFPLMAACVGWLLGRSPKRLLQEILGWLALAVVCAIVARSVQITEGDPDLPLWSRLFLATDALTFYLFKIVWPWRLVLLYDRRAVEMIHRPAIFVTWIVPLAIFISLWIWRKSARPYIAAALIFVLGVLPVLNLVPYEFQVYSINADHYVYVAMFGVALVVATFLASMTEQSRSHSAAIPVLLVLAALTFRQSLNWRDTYSLFDHALSINPNTAAAHNALAAACLRDGRFDDAISHAERATKLPPENPSAHANLAIAYDAVGRTDDATAEYRAAARIEPNLPNAYVALAAESISRGNRAVAVTYLQRASRMDPTNAVARAALQNLGATTQPGQRP